jgi:histidine triad (HIT) family protein
MSCLFCRIAAGEIPSKKVHEDDRIIAFHDIDPKAPVHVLIIPRKHIASVVQLDESDAGLMGQMLVVARDLAKKLGMSEHGFRCVVNSGPDAGQSVDHIHLHVLGGRNLKWPPG